MKTRQTPAVEVLLPPKELTIADRQARVNELQVQLAAIGPEIDRLRGRRSELSTSAFIEANEAALEEIHQCAEASARLTVAGEGIQAAIAHERKEIAILADRDRREKEAARQRKREALIAELMELGAGFDSVCREMNRLADQIEKKRHDVWAVSTASNPGSRTTADVLTRAVQAAGLLGKVHIRAMHGGHSLPLVEQIQSIYGGGASESEAA